MTPTMPTAQIIDGKALAAKVEENLTRRITALKTQDRPVRLDAIIAAGPSSGGGGSASGGGGSTSGGRVYAQNQARMCAKLGIEYTLHELPADAGYDEIAGRVLLLNTDDAVTAIMVHLPLPAAVDTERIQSLIAVEKDVEGVNPANIGNVVYGRRSLIPCTARAVMEMIESTAVPLPGSTCVCVGASNIVGKPVAILLMRAEATVISANEHTKNLTAFTREADILISAAGVPGLIKADMVKPGAVLIDVGITRIKDASGKKRTVGDVDFDPVSKIAGWLSPVPGGVGPLTVAMLLRNTVKAAER